MLKSEEHHLKKSMSRQVLKKHFLHPRERWSGTLITTHWATIGVQTYIYESHYEVFSDLIIDYNYAMELRS